MQNQESATQATRLDIWLWAARFYKTRSLAKQAVVTGKVDVGGQRAKSSRAVRVGDVLAITRGDDTYEIEVRGLSDQRGPAPAAQALYAESEASRARSGPGAAAGRACRLPGATVQT